MKNAKKILVIMIFVSLLFIVTSCENTSNVLPNLEGMSRAQISEKLDKLNIQYDFFFSSDIIRSDEDLDKFCYYGSNLKAGDHFEPGQYIRVYTTVLPLTVNLLDEVTMDFTVTDEDSFVDDGKGIVTLSRTVDGDTAYFYDKNASDPNERNIRVRFIGVDTPESTIQHDPWGKAASTFTANRLRNAKEIILESYGARKDTYNRYLAFVWVDGKLLNLELIQEAYSNSTINSSFKYGNIFISVSVEVSKTGRRFFGETDPNY